VADERVVAITLEQIEQYHGELTAKQAALSRRESTRRFCWSPHSLTSCIYLVNRLIIKLP